MKFFFLHYNIIAVALIFSSRLLFLRQSVWRKLPISKGERAFWTQSDACKIKDFKLLYHTLGPSGGTGDWFPKNNNMIVYARWDENEIKQIYSRNLNNDVEECLTCAYTPGAPPVDVHKGWPSFDSTGRFLIFQAGMEQYRGKKWAKVTEPGAGWYQNIWVFDLEENKWRNLTNYSDDAVHGVLVPRISHNGKKLGWAELYQKGGWLSFLGAFNLVKKGPIWGYWQISIADFVVDEKGARLENIKRYRPGEATFYEFQDWSPDDQTIVFSSDIGMDTPYREDIWFFDLTSEKATLFINSAKDEWDEHATYTNSGRKIVYLSSKCCHWDVYDWKSLATELYLSDIDGSNEAQLTHFNDPEYSESQVGQGRAIAVKGVFNQDGSKMILEQMIIPYGKDAVERETNHWLLTFEGECGKQ